MIVQLDEFMAYAVSEDNENVMCPILTWSGGDNGNLNAVSLVDVVQVGNMVYYEAAICPDGLKARWWSTNSSGRPHKNSSAQTAITVEQMVLRTLSPDILNYLRRTIPTIVQFAKNP
ncbi:unnamed protein product [Gongylonema pulchrum]|uniref:Transposase n=1 Tax=Gongylonema pulchrum TaxID=637853 RepID=A0A183CY25_9BILA|nr:unnamed protein product [Gongylonema pulchrum]